MHIDRSRTRLRWWLALLVLALTAAACGGDDGDEESADTSDVSVEAPDTTEADSSQDGTSGRPAGGTQEGQDTDPPPEETDPGDGDGLDEPVVMNAAGVDTGSGLLEFGASAETVIEELTFFLGPPTDDTGSTATDAGCPSPSDTYRIVSWGELQLTFLSQSQFSDGPDEHLAFWFNTGIDVVNQAFVGDSTSVAIVPGETTVADLKNAFGDLVEVFDGDPFGPQFAIEDNFGTLRGELSGLNDDDVVLGVNAGLGCGE